MVSLLTVVNLIPVMAQQMPPIPVDKNVKMGKLDNGLTYYIRKNNWPENMANFYIAQRVGSIQENDDQRGLAHFLEHMAFNGSDNFKGNGIIDYTRSLGVGFGSDLNAYTSIDETVYRICNVPTKRQAALDSCLLILKDWSNGLLLEEEEIDKERGVIHEEWRMRSSATQRMLERALPALYPGSKYGHRMPIGLMEIVDNFKPEALRAYYRKWYRPDNQAIIVVGDIDVDKTEADIKRLFGGIQLQPNAAQVVPEVVPDNAEAIYICEKDKEQQNTGIMVMMKHEARAKDQKKNVDYIVENYVKNMICSMLNARFSEIAQNADCPFLGAQSDDGIYLLSKTKGAFETDLTPKDGKEKEALVTVLKELRRAAEFGFTATEFERMKADFQSSYDKRYEGRNKINNHSFGTTYSANYISGEPMMSIEDEYQLMTQLIGNLPLEVFNMAVKELVSLNDSNLVVLSIEQEKEGKTYLTPELLKSAMAEARTAKVEAYVDNVKNEPIVDEAKLPKAGTIKKETENKTLGYKELTLSNGVRVILKKTDFKENEIIMTAFADGGTNLYGEADFSNLKVLTGMVEASGLGGFSNNEMRKALAGKNAGVGASFGGSSTSLSGTCVPKDLETMMQLTYLYFTDITKDQKSYDQQINMLKVQLQNKGLSPEVAFRDSVNVTANCHNPRFNSMELDEIDKLNYDRQLQIARELLSAPGSFTYIFLGNFDEAKLRDYLCKYVACLPTGKALQRKEINTLAKGLVKNNFTRKMETAKANAQFIWWSDAPYTLDNIIKSSVAGQVLSMYYLKTIREDASAAYSVGAQGYANRSDEHQRVFMHAVCPMNPEKSELACKLLNEGLADMTKSVDADNLKKVKELELKQADENVKTNGYWMGKITTYLRYGIDTHTDYKKTVEALTPQSISAYVKNVLLKDGNHIEVTMMPE